MKNIRVLDCTLRDGGRVINCAFPDDETRGITAGLTEAKIDIIEVGFLRDHRNVNYNGNSTFFTDTEQIIPFLPEDRKALYTAFIDYGMFDFDSLRPYNPASVDGLRFGFTKKDYTDSKDDIIRCMRLIKAMGYKLFVQGVNSLSYSDREILELVDMINEVQPYSFGIVDTYGAMYIDDVTRLYGLIDNNLDYEICINFHSHNNYQLSFAFAQEVIKLGKGDRKIIIDSTLCGMGKVAGNLNTELIVNYLVRKLHYDYEFDGILDIIDKYIYKYASKYKWGYSVPAMMAGVYKSHPNNIIYLTEKFSLHTRDIEKLLAMIDPQKRQRYDYDNIERIYMEYTAVKVDDREALCELKQLVSGRDVLVIVPGNLPDEHRRYVDSFVREYDPLIISVNFLTDYEGAYVFYGNQRRYNNDSALRTRDSRIIAASNVKPNPDEQNVITVNYYGLINRGYKYFENSTMMLLNLLRKVEARKIFLAGFDGFTSEKESNYVDPSFQNDRYAENFSTLNREIKLMLREYRDITAGKCEIRFLTPSRFEEIFM